MSNKLKNIFGSRDYSEENVENLEENVENINDGLLKDFQKKKNL